MKKSTKLLVLLLSVVLICAGLVIATSADTSTPGASYVDADGNTKTASDLATAIANAKEGTTVTLTGDTTVSASIDVTKTITIDLNGYTLNTTANPVFKVNNNETATKFNIVGNGTINVANALITDSAKSSEFEANIVGGKNGIVINHTSKEVTMVTAKKGTWNISGLKVTSAIAKSEKYIFSADGALNLNINALNVIASAIKGGITGNNNAAFVYVNSTAHVDVRNTKLDSEGIAAFYVQGHQTKNDNLLNVDNCDINVAYGNSQSSLITCAWGNLGSDIVISNSYISINQRTIINTSTNNAAIILRNTVLNHNGGTNGAFFRSTNVKLEAGSVLTGTHSSYATDVQIFTNAASSGSLTVGSQSGVNLVLYKGARFSTATYNKIMNPTGTKADGKAITYYNDGQIVYEDGSKPIGSTTYKIVYDPSGNAEYPYVVVDYNYESITAPTYEHVFNTGFTGTSTGSKNPSIYNPTGTYGQITAANYNRYWRFISSGEKNTNGSSPEFLFTKATVTADAYDVVVVETDFAGDTFNGFSAVRMGIQTNSKFTGLFKVNNDGTITDEYKCAAEGAPTKLSLGEWHRATMVVDIKASNKVYCYIDGMYYGSKDLGTTAVSGATGPRLSVDGATDKNASVFIDNVSVRGYGDGTGSALTDNGAKFLGADGGKANNKGIVASDALTTALGYPVSDVNDFAKAELYVNRDVRFAQNVTTEDVSINTNGYSFPYTKDSLPVYIERNEAGEHTYYNFNSSYEGATYKFFFGDVNDASQLADPEYWTDAVSVKLGHYASSVYEGPDIADHKNVAINNHWYDLTYSGWSTEMNSISSDTPLYPDVAENNKGNVIEMYPSYDATLLYTFVVLNSDGSFNRGLTKKANGGAILDKGAVYGSGFQAVRLAYGETLVLQKDFIAQSDFNNIWNQGSKDANAENKTLSVDFNGHVVKFDSLHAQSQYRNVNTVFSIEKGETLNVYSSYPGAKLENYGVNTSSNNKISGGVLFKFAAGERVNNDNGTIDKLATINKNVDGATTQHNATLNVGTVTVNGMTIPGSNLTVSASTIVNAETGDSTCKINVDGVTAIRNVVDYTGMFVNRTYFGEFNVTNCTIINPVSAADRGAIVDGHTDAIADTNGNGKNDVDDSRALAKMTFDGCVIILKDDGAPVVAGNYSFESLTFKNCTTNGKINPSNISNIVDVAEGNAYFSRTATPNSAVSEVAWNNGMTLGAVDTITVAYLTLNPDIAIDKNDVPDYISHSYTFAINGYTGEADHVLPVLPKKTVIKGEELIVTFKGVVDEGKTYKYAPGATLTEIPDINGYDGKVVTFVPDGTFDKEVATIVTESVVYTPNFTAKANVTGIKANLSLYANFNVNLYVPAEYEGLVTVEGYEYKTVNVGGVDYLQVTEEQLCSNASDGIVFALNITEAGYEANTTVTVSITSYASTILGGEYTDADKVLMCYMLGYANEAEKFFDGAANETVTALLTEYADYTAKYNYVKDYDNKNVTNTGLTSAFTSASVSLKSAPAFVLTLKDGFVGTVTVKYGTNNVRTYNVTADTARTITIEGMKVYNFGTYLEISATGTIGTEAVEITDGKYTLDTFAAYHEANANNENSATAADSAACLDLIEALSAYAEVAELYKTGALEGIINPTVAE